jgi:hypothetical protein
MPTPQPAQRASANAADVKATREAIAEKKAELVILETELVRLEDIQIQEVLNTLSPEALERLKGRL